MQLTDAPGKLVLPFADAGAKNAIPVASQIGITAGAASLTDGFPPLTRTPLAAGGTPPSGLDMNGVLFELSAILRWANAGAGYVYDGTFAADSNVGGYPKGARVLRSDGLGYWFNTTDDNDTDPEGAGAVAAGWVPDFTTGASAITMTSSNVTLSALQYGKPVIVISGLLTANLNLIFPDIVGQWTVINNTTGAYSITCKTAAGTGVVVTGVQSIVGDGTNVYLTVTDSDPVAIQGTFKNLAISAGGVAASVTVSYDELILGDGAGAYVTERGVSGSITTTATGAGGLDTGTLSGSTWYSIWRIGKTDGTRAFLFSLSSTAPTMPADYTLKARIGWFRTDGTANKYPLAFTQVGPRVQYKVTVGSNVTDMPLMASGVASQWTAVGVSAFSPPTASIIKIVPSVQIGSASWSMAIAPNNAFPASYSRGVWVNTQGGTLTVTIQTAIDLMLESTNIYWGSSAAGLGIYIIGWEDTL